MHQLRYFFALCFISLMVSCDKDTMTPVDPNPDPDPIDSSASLYFPPLQHDTWATIDPDSLGWDSDKLNDLYDYLEEKKTKGFIIIKDGKIVVEEYFNDHTVNKNWEWYSAAKSLTSSLVGIATMEGLLDVEAKTSDYLGANWSSLTDEQQDMITVKNHMTMTTGLKNKINNFIEWTCTVPLCMQYEVDAGTRWAYHQGAFTLTQDIITQAVGLNFKQYCKEKIQDKIGMNGSWNQLLDVRIFSSTTRSMARFGLLTLNEGEWDGEIVYSKEYHEAMTQTSQDHNKAYGYLWWLNGKPDFLSTANQTLLSGPLVPNAPSDMYAALGAQDQKIYVIPSENMVVVRCGETPGNVEFANSSFDNELWGKLINLW